MMLFDERNKMNGLFFGEIQRITAYRGTGETLLQAYNPVHQAEGGDPSRFLRIEDADGYQKLGSAVLAALEVSGYPESAGEQHGWLLMRSSKPDVLPLWNKLVRKAAICLVERSAFSIAITPTKKWPAGEDAPSYAPIEKESIHLPLNTDPTELGEQLLLAFAKCS